ncbi:TPA: ead/Ea22-like family protein [Klebsiella pneumoniae]
MSEINYQALREAEEKATKGRWAVEFDDEIYSTDGVNHEQIAMVFSENEARDAAFIAAANPATVLALLDELEAKDKQIGDLKATAAHSNAGWKEAHEQEARAEAAEKRIAELEAKLDSADKLQDSAFRHGLQHGFSLGQTDNQAGFEECLSAYGTGKGE